MQEDELPCPFCNIRDDEIIASDDICFAIWDPFPVSKGHVLVIPKRHVSSYFDMRYSEKISILQLIETCKEMIDQKYHPNAYNIGINIGKPAGQTVMHCHVHIIPRFIGDITDPTGGVRGVIPDKRTYKSN